MQIQQHLTASRRFLEAAALLENEGYAPAAAEMIWGATVQSLEAIGHIKAGNVRGTLSNRRRRELARTISPGALSRYYNALHELHGHFYKNHLHPAELAIRMQQGRNYVAELLSLAFSSEPYET